MYFLHKSFLLFCSILTTTVYAQSYTSLVNPFLGSEGGNVFVGASLPFGLVKVGPDVDLPQPTSGYTTYKNIRGFSHTHLSGTGGGPRYGNIQLIPQAGPVTITNVTSLKKSNEMAFPGYYSVLLARTAGDVKCEITCSQKTGMHRYEFFTWKEENEFDGSILIDVSHTNTRGKSTDARCTGATVKINPPDEITGQASFSGGWGQQNPFTIYFSARFDTPFSSFGTWKDSILYHSSLHTEGKSIGAYAGYKLTQHQQIQVKVSISYISIEQARKNQYEIPDWNFSTIRKKADSIWNSYLGKIQIEGGLPEERTLFYSCLRNTLIMPTDHTGENPNWESTEPHYWDHYCIWDVFRSVMPLHTILYPKRQTDIIRSLLDIYKHKGWLPEGWTSGDYANVQGGSNADVVIADAMVKGLKGFDYNLAFEAIRKNGETNSDNPVIYGRYLTDYLTYGYILPSTIDGVSSRTLEYAYNDFCIAQAAKILGKKELQQQYIERSLNSFKLFYDKEKYFWAKDSAGNWMPDFSLDSKRSDSWNDPYFYEGGSQTYSYYVPHDMQGLINRHGGNEAFIQSLDDLFNSNRFKLSNEPFFLVPYSYNYAGRQDKTAFQVRNILQKQFSASRNGLPGQDDSGALSSWYVFSSIGFFPVAGQDVYLIGSPLFTKTTIKLDSGKTFIISASNTSAENIYIQSAKLNGKPLNKSWIQHADIINGGKLELIMGNTPSSWGKDNPPPSISKK